MYRRCVHRLPLHFNSNRTFFFKNWKFIDVHKSRRCTHRLYTPKQLEIIDTIFWLQLRYNPVILNHKYSDHVHIVRQSIPQSISHTIGACHVARLQRRRLFRHHLHSKYGTLFRRNCGREDESDRNRTICGRTIAQCVVALSVCRNTVVGSDAQPYPCNCDY